MDTRLLSGAVSAFALALAAATPGQAATMTQSIGFEHNDVLSTNDLEPLIEQTRSTTLHFDRFDSSLGTLTGAQWTLASTENFDLLYITGFVPAITLLDRVRATVKQGSDFIAISGSLGVLQVFDCGAGGLCDIQQSLTSPLNADVAAPALAPFLSASGVDATLNSSIRVSGTAGALADPDLTIALSQFHWTGALSLTYTYDPFAAGAGVPEPSSWATLILGFGAAGTALRRARRVRSPA